MTKPKEEEREVRIDVVKGIACLLVLLGHLFQGLVKSGIMENSLLYEWFDFTIYFFHVPVFFICSGYLYQKRSHIISWQEWGRNVCEKAVNLGIPYVIFSLATYLLKVVFSGSVNQGNEKGFLETILTEPLSPYWYLYILFFLFVCFPTLKNRKQTIIMGGLVVFLFFMQRNPYIIEIFPIQGVFRWGIWFFIGMLLAHLKINVKFQTKYLLLSFLLIPGTILGVGKEMGNVLWIFYSFIIGILGCLLVFQTGCLLAGKLSQRGLQFCAENTMPIFLMHTIFAAGFRSVLLRLGVVNAAAHVVAGIVISILGPVIVTLILRKSRYLYWMIQPGFRVSKIKMKK